MDFIKWYRGIINSAEEEPPARVWEEIQDQLDVDAVWVNIEKEFHAASRERTFYRLAAAASLLLLIGAGFFFHTASRENAYGDLVISRQEMKIPDPANFTSEPTIRAPRSKISDFPSLRRSAYEPDTTYQPSADFYDTTEGSLYAEIIAPRAFKQYEPLRGEIKHGLSIRTVHTGKSETVAETATESKIFLREGYYAGITGHLANTWLLNNKTFQGLRSDEFTASLPSFGYNLGIIAGKNIGARFAVQADIYILSFSRQDYNEYLHGRYINSSMKFTYSSFGLYGKLYFPGRENNGNHSLVIGAYTGILRNASRALNGESISLTNEYSSTDFGISAGYEYHYYLGSGISIGTGFQSRFGLNNIFTGNEVIPDYLNSTRNASMNIIFSVRYNLK